MKFTSALVFVFGVVSANPLIQKRATVSDPANFGYATLYGGTTGGGTTPYVVVTTLPALQAAVAGSASKVVVVAGAINGNAIVSIGPNTSVIGKTGATLTGISLLVSKSFNVIIRNLKINKVLAKVGDHIAIKASHNVWVDSVEIWSDQSNGPNYYDGLLDITNGAYGISVTNSYFHDHWNASLAGDSDYNEKEDRAINVTYAYNKWAYLNSRTPLVRFGHAHICGSYFLKVIDGINTRLGAQLLVENNVFESVVNPLYSETGDGFANDIGNYFDPSSGGNTAPPTGWVVTEYPYRCLKNDSVKAYVEKYAGATLALP